MIEPEGMRRMTEQELEDFLKEFHVEIDREQMDYAHWNGNTGVLVMKPSYRFSDESFLRTISSFYPGYQAIKASG